MRAHDCSLPQITNIYEPYWPQSVLGRIVQLTIVIDSLKAHCVPVVRPQY